MSPFKKISLAVVTVALTASLAGCGSESEEPKLTAQQQQEVAERLAPEGKVALESEVVSSVTAAPVVDTAGRTGQQVFDTKCFTCHATGAAGAPKMGSASDWADRIAQGVDTLYANAINGIRGMPPKGLCFDCSDEELKAAVDHMVGNSQ